MDLYEYQGKQLFARYGIPVSDGGVADTVDEALALARDIGKPRLQFEESLLDAFEFVEHSGHMERL